MTVVNEFLTDLEGKFTSLLLIGMCMLSLGLIWIGGTELQDDIHLFNTRGAHIVVATPGRLNHMIQSCSNFNVRGLEVLVFDEADRLLDLGFNVVIQSILERFPKQRRTVG